MKRKLAIFLLHPYLLSILNVLMLVLAYSCLKASWVHLQPENHFSEAAELWEGFGTILLGLGVLLEERSSLQHILGFDPLALLKKEEDAVEHVCHDYGVIFVVLGVIVELFAWLVKMPNDALDTYNAEFILINIAAFTAAVGVILQFRFQYELVFAHLRNRKAIKN